MKSYIYFFTLLLIGCSYENSETKIAQDKTPVKYIICSPGEKNCFVSARFTNFDGCESHKKWSIMICDSDSNPGKMICITDGNRISASYCTL